MSVTHPWFGNRPARWRNVSARADRLRGQRWSASRRFVTGPGDSDTGWPLLFVAQMTVAGVACYMMAWGSFGPWITTTGTSGELAPAGVRLATLMIAISSAALMVGCIPFDDTKWAIPPLLLIAVAGCVCLAFAFVAFTRTWPLTTAVSSAEVIPPHPHAGWGLWLVAIGAFVLFCAIMSAVHQLPEFDRSRWPLEWVMSWLMGAAAVETIGFVLVAVYASRTLRQ